MHNERRVLPHTLTSLAIAAVSREGTEVARKDGKRRARGDSVRGVDSWNTFSSLKLGTDACRTDFSVFSHEWNRANKRRQ